MAMKSLLVLTLCVPLALGDVGAAAAPDGSSAFIAQLNALLTEELPNLNSELTGVLPHSYGAGGPAPCLGGHDLYYEHKAWEYKVIMRWLTGINTLHLDTAVASGASEGVTLALKGHFAELPASIYIGECFTFDQCSILWDNTHACCGSNKHFEVVVTAKCTEASALEGFTLDSLYLDDIKITESIIGISFDVEHITNQVKSQISGVLKQYLISEAFIQYNGQSLTLVQYLNTYPQAKQIVGAICSQVGQDVTV